MSLGFIMERFATYLGFIFKNKQCTTIQMHMFKEILQQSSENIYKEEHNELGSNISKYSCPSL